MTPVVATLNELLRIYLTSRPRTQAVGQVNQGRLDWCSTPQLAERIRSLSLGLQSRGVKPGDRVAVLSENRWEWLVTDFAILAAGAVNVPLHPGLGARSIGYILQDSGARLAFVSTAALTKSLLAGGQEAVGLHTVIAFDPPAVRQQPLISLGQLMEQGRSHGESHPGQYRRVRDAVTPGDLASLIYTSGTTGRPKGVMLTHGNIASNISASCSVFDFRRSDVALSFLPLCHIFERTVDYCYLHSGCQVVHLPDLKRLAQALPLVRPSVFAAVPRVYEKLHSRILRHVPERRRRLFDWALKVGLKAVRRRQRGQAVGPWLAVGGVVADRLVFRKIRAGLGGRVRFSLSGGAPLAQEIAEFFLATGLQVLEGYGLTESSPVITTNRVNEAHLGTVGPALPGVEVRVAPDGEILARAASIMKGYWQDEVRTREAIDPEGWLATGDIGVLGADGYLRITDRKKEIIVTAQGKNVAPQPIENVLKSLPLVSQVALVGDRRPYLVALIVPDFQVLESEAVRLGLEHLSLAQQLTHQALRSVVEKGIARATAGLDRHEQIRRFVLLEREFSQEEDELTPTLKLKRRSIQAHFGHLIEALYAGASELRV